MRLNKQQQVIASVLVVGIGALVVDRFVLGEGGPDEAAASDLLVAPGAEAPAPHRKTRSVAQQFAGLRRAALPQPAGELDAFAAPTAWAGLIDPSLAKNLTGVADGTGVTLTGVFLSKTDPASSAAFISGRTYKVGALCHGMRVTSIGVGRVTLEGDGREVVLLVDDAEPEPKE